MGREELNVYHGSYFLPHSDTEVQLRGCQALASFFCDRESRVQVGNLAWH